MGHFYRLSYYFGLMDYLLCNKNKQFFNDPSYFVKIVNILLILQSVCKLMTVNELSGHFNHIYSLLYLSRDLTFCQQKSM